MGCFTPCALVIGWAILEPWTRIDEHTVAFAPSSQRQPCSDRSKITKEHDRT